MLAFIGFAGFQEATGQELCPGVPFDNGWVRFDVTPAASPNTPTFTAGLLGLVTTDLTSTFGGLDWLYNDDSTSSAAAGPGSGSNTTVIGTQLVGWWSQAGGRSTQIQVTNPVTTSTQSSFLGTDALSVPLPLSIHVQLLDSNCVEVLDFCDTYTPQDTHVYDLANIVTNAGVNVPEAQIAGKEGIITITPVVSCPTDDRAITYNFIYGTSRMISASAPYDYGVNLWARDAEANPFVAGSCAATPVCTAGNIGASCTTDAECDVAGVCGFEGPTGAICSVGNIGASCSINADCDIVGSCAATPVCTAGNIGASCTIDTECDVPGCTNTVAGGGAFILNGTSCALRLLEPALLSQNFSSLPSSIVAARADVVLMSIQDAYNESQPTLGYTPLAATATFFPDIVDVNETPVSCPSQPVCFARLGIDDTVLNTDTPLPTPTPTPSPSPGASPSLGTSPTLSTSPGSGGGGGGSCAISGVAGPVSASALADILIPLLPVFGFGLVRRVASRRRKEEK